MNDQELRQMIRDSIARHTGGAVHPAPEGRTPPSLAGHASFARLPLASGDEAGACVIEPSVQCNHCGYCLSYGH